MRGQSSQKRNYYFFDYLFWLGEMAQWHYKGEPRRPDGESMLMLCIMIFIYEPDILYNRSFPLRLPGIWVVYSRHDSWNRRSPSLCFARLDIPVFTKESGHAAL